MKKIILLLLAIFLAGTLFAELHFGPISAIQKKVREYEENIKPPPTDPIILPANFSGSFDSPRGYHLSQAISSYTITGDAIFTSFLIIDSTVTIKFAGPYSFKANCKVTAIGTKTNPIVFTSGKSAQARGDYNNVNLGKETNTDDTTLKYVTFEYGTSQNIYGNSGALVENCTFADSNLLYTNLYTNGTVKNCDFLRNRNLSSLTGDTMDIFILGAPQITYCNIAGYVNSDLGAGQYRINDSNLTKNSFPVLQNNANYTIEITNNYWVDNSTTTLFVTTTPLPPPTPYITITHGHINYSTSSFVTSAGVQ